MKKFNEFHVKINDWNSKIISLAQILIQENKIKK